MQLNANGTVTREARQVDLARAFESRQPKGEWSITLEQADGSYLQAFALQGGKYRLTSRQGDMQTDGRDELEAQTAAKVLSQYLSGDPSWRDAMDWKAPPTGKLTGTRDVFTDESKGLDLQTTPQALPQRPASPAAIVGLLALVLAGLIGYGAITKGPAAIAKYFPHASGDPRLAVLVGSMGLFALLFGLASLLLALRARSWPTASVEVTSSGVEEDITQIGSGGGQSHSRVYRPRVQYRYTVAGQSYSCQQITLGVTVASGQARAQGIAARYPTGAHVMAYYDPRNPGRAFLEYSLSAPVFGFALAVGFFAFFARIVGIY